MPKIVSTSTVDGIKYSFVDAPPLRKRRKQELCKFKVQWLGADGKVHMVSFKRDRAACEFADKMIESGIKAETVRVIG